MGRMDLRKSQRYEFPLPVAIHYPVGNVAPPQIVRVSNISARGVYFLLEDGPGLGTELKATITMPGDITGGSEVSIDFIGKVLRVEPRMEGTSEKFGVAVTIDKYEMIRNN